MAEKYPVTILATLLQLVEILPCLESYDFASWTRKLEKIWYAFITKS
jgi:hypothetical protein